MVPAQSGDLLACRYRLRGVIGSGGMGVVWAATDELLNRDVAIKESIRPPDLEDAEWAEFREHSLSEARTAARLSHRNIVGIFDILEHDGQPWLVMQLLPFPSLRDVVKSRGPLSPAHAAQVGLCLLSAIRAAHAAGILHRDVKPGNVLLGPDDQVVLTDFGLAVSAGSPRATGSGMIVGSPAYMSPERARGWPAGPADDLWSLGATLYAAVEGRDPFERGGSEAVLAAVLTSDPDAPLMAGPLWPVISGLLRKDPRQRLTADQTQRMLTTVAGRGHRAGLADAAAGPGTARPAPTLTVPAYESRDAGRRRARLLTVGVLASVIAVAVGAFLAAGELVRHHAAVPSVTRSASPVRVPSAVTPSPSQVPQHRPGHLRHEQHDPAQHLRGPHQHGLQRHGLQQHGRRYQHAQHRTRNTSTRNTSTRRTATDRDGIEGTGSRPRPATGHQVPPQARPATEQRAPAGAPPATEHRTPPGVRPATEHRAPARVRPATGPGTSTGLGR